MDRNTVSPEMQKKINTFCRKISVAYDLDKEIREELYGHIEDKLLDYVNGKEKLTEDDAFVIVREHFGNPDNVKVLLQEAHGCEAQRSSAIATLEKSFLAIVAGIIAAWFLTDFFFDAITKHATLANLPLLYTKVMEPLIVKLQISIFMGILMALPFISCYILFYMSPDLYILEKKRIFTSAIGAALCFIAGASFSILILYPSWVNFIKHFIIGDIMPLIAMSAFAQKIMKISLLIGFMFELPIVTFILVQIGFLKHTWPSRNRKYAIVVIFILGALLTPPDPLSQIMTAIPLIILYEISVQIARITGRKKLLKIS